MSEEKRCTGHCCRAFDLSIPYEELMAEPKKFGDGEMVAAMLIPLGVLSDEEVKERHGLSRIGHSEPHARFTCKHLSGSGDCSIYENRPKMCADYPSEKLKACMWKECAASCGLMAKLENVFGDANLECKHG